MVFPRSHADSLHEAVLVNLDLDKVWVVYSGQRTYPLGNGIVVRLLTD